MGGVSDPGAVAAEGAAQAACRQSPAVLHAAAASRNRSTLAVRLAIVCFANYYKPLLCGVLAHGVGIHVVCDTSVSGISTNHWIEILLYCPVMWLGLHVVRGEVFATVPADATTARRNRRYAAIADFAIAIMLYGFGIHIANVIEIYTRQDIGITHGRVYELTYFLDEGLSHYVILLAEFFVLGWFILHDPPGRTHLAWLAPLLGVGFGVERAVGFTEAGKWFLAGPVLVWFAIALRMRVARHAGSWAAAWGDFLFRFGVAFCVTFPIALAWYRIEFGSFTQPSRLPEAQDATLALGIVILTLAGVAAVVATSRWHVGRWRRRGAPVLDVSKPVSDGVSPGLLHER